MEAAFELPEDSNGIPYEFISNKEKKMADDNHLIFRNVL